MELAGYSEAFRRGEASQALDATTSHVLTRGATGFASRSDGRHSRNSKTSKICSATLFATVTWKRSSIARSRCCYTTASGAASPRRMLRGGHVRFTKALVRYQPASNAPSSPVMAAAARSSGPMGAALRLRSCSSITSCRSPRGGKPTVENIRLRCAAHNRYEADLFFGRGNYGLLREQITEWP